MTDLDALKGQRDYARRWLSDIRAMHMRSMQMNNADAEKAIDKAEAQMLADEEAIEQLRAELATVASERDESWDALDRLGEAMKAAGEFRDMARRAGGPEYLYTLPWEQSND